MAKTGQKIKASPRRASPRKKAKSPEKKKTGLKKSATRITIRYDAGLNNNLYIRGEGAGLSWDHGVMLKNVGPDEWVWETSLPFNECEFKALLNDQQYEDGGNHHLDGGIWLQYSPHF